MAGLTASAGLAASMATGLGRSLVTATTAKAGRVLRAGGMGTNAHNNRDSTGSTQWSCISRDGYHVDDAFDYIEIAVPLWTLESQSGAVMEVDLAEPYDFAVALEYPFTEGQSLPNGTTYRLKWNGGTDESYHYVRGQSETFAVATLQLPFTIPAFAKFGLLLNHECVAGRSGPVRNKRINRPDGADSKVQHNAGGMAVATSLIASDGVMTQKTFRAASGSSAPMAVGAIRTYHRAGKPSVLVNGNSLEQGTSEGTGNASNLRFGDTSGDAYGNRGWATRLCQKLGIAASQMSRGSDSDSARLLPGNYVRRMALAAWMKPTHQIDMNPHNDTATAAAPSWAAGRAYALDDMVIVPGQGGYICVRGGTSGAAAPTGMGADIADGGCRWTYVGPHDMGSASARAIAWVGRRRRRLRLDQAANPGVRLIGVTLTPDATEVMRAVTHYAYDGATGDLQLTAAGDIADIAVGNCIRLSGLTPAPLNTSGTTAIPVTAISGQVMTVSRPAGLAEPGGTAVFASGWNIDAQQVPSASFTAGNSFRSWINRFLRHQPNPVLPYAGIVDIGRIAESGHPATAAGETGKWTHVLKDGAASRGSDVTSDGTHGTSQGYDLIASASAADPAVAALFS